MRAALLSARGGEALEAGCLTSPECSGRTTTLRSDQTSRWRYAQQSTSSSLNLAPKCELSRKCANVFVDGPRLRPRTQADAEPLNALRNGLFKMVVEQLGRTNDLLSEKLRHRELRLRDELGGTLRALASQLHALRGSADKEIARVRAQYDQDKAEVIRDAKRESLVRGPLGVLAHHP